MYSKWRKASYYDSKDFVTVILVVRDWMHLSNKGGLA